MSFLLHFSRYRAASRECQSAEATIKRETEQTAFLKRIVDEKSEQVLLHVFVHSMLQLLSLILGFYSIDLCVSTL